MIIDVTEVETELPKYNQKDWFSGKKWMHTVKFQTVINANTNEILNIFSDIGKNYDFKTFKNSKLKFLPETIILADKGYQGLQKIHANTFLPIKISKNNPKTNKTKIFNKIINKTRRKIEHVFAFLKCFKIIGYKFRKARKRIFLRFNLIAGFYNLSLKLKNVMQ
ncbi:transposase family protein [Spiroplasma endosymbiont of Notiophilus biguttatus]|uniref:transposase family protein n=1 Tax=Spiroplasma endosymbiont of Notiophilus biguttatus TaxID=3066285 RepID=UPI00313E3646